MTTADSMSGYCVSFDPTVGVGALGAHVPQTFVRGDTWMNIDNNIRSKQDCNSQPVINAASHIPKDGDLNNWYVNETGRGEINPQNESQLNLKGQEVWNNLSFNDGQKVTTKETTEYAYAGNAQRENDGTEFWTYDDDLKTTIKETTEYAYAGNTQRENDGSKFWTYDDDLKTTNKETTEYAYAGNTARGDLGTTSYNQYTGFNKDGKNKKRNGGADTYALRGATLVENWTPIAGRQNLLGEAQSRMGKIDFGTFGSDQNYDGPGTIRQALPDGSKYQFQYIIGKIHPDPNKLQAVDDRQIAGYQVNQLQQNPLSIYTVNPESKIPSLFEFIQPDSYSTMVQEPETNLRQPKAQYEGLENSVQVYPTINEKQENPNAAVVYNQSIDSTDPVNQFVVQDPKLNSQPTFTGKAYSGNVNFGWDKQGQAKNAEKITLGGQNEPGVYGNLYSSVPFSQGMAQGIQNTSLQNQQENMRPPNVCEGNPALDFATNTLILNSVGGN